MESLRVFWGELEAFRYGVILLFVLTLTYIYHVIRRCVIVSRKVKPIDKQEHEGVSVIITSHNNAECLRRNLPSFLMQAYDNFEVIVVDECSEDDTQDVLTEIQKDYPQLRCTRIFPDTKFRFTKKLAINIGVLAAKHDILLFSEINCRPSSMYWVKTMESYFDENTAAVVGFANYDFTEQNVRNSRMFRFLRFIKMMVMVKNKKYIFGDGCNMAYRKSYYIENRGFAKNSQSYLGYDNDMVRELSRFGAIKMTKDPDSYVIIDKSDKKGEINEVSYYYANKMRLAITGDEQAYAELFKRYKDSVYFMILKMVNNRTDAEDLMFEAFEKAFTSLNYYSPQFAFSTWLFKIASNNTIDFIRKKKAKIVSLDKDDINPDDRGYINSVPADVLNPEEETIRKQRAEFMREKVAMLKGRYRKLIELRYFEEYSYEEIAQELAIPLGTVKAQLFRARELLLNILQNSEIARENERV